MKRMFLAAATLLFSVFLIFIKKKPPSYSGVQTKEDTLQEIPPIPNIPTSKTNMDDKQVDPLPFRGDLSTTMTIIQEILEQDEDVVSIYIEKNYISAVFSSPTLRLKDDVEFYFDEINAKIDYRSASRIGYSDIGVNKRRYRQFRDSYLSR